jgi:pyruvate formate lyase activating enzyme
MEVRSTQDSGDVSLAGEMKACVTNIQRFSINDGPGIRTNVYLKGCPLKCPWCHNPETQHPWIEFYWSEAKCVRCGACAGICPEGAITPPGVKGEPPVRDRSKCTRCMKCVEVCPEGALEIVGRELTIDEIMDEVRSDKIFYESSGGGLTISGGEPLLFPEITRELAKSAKKGGADAIHVALDTCGYSPKNLEEVLDYVDMVLLDVKHLDEKKLKEVTGIPLDSYLTSARMIAERGKEIILRVPIVYDFNDNEEFIEELAKLGKELGKAVVRIDLLPFHNSAEVKYNQLDRGDEYAYKGYESMTEAEVEDFKEMLESQGFKVTIGG